MFFLATHARKPRTQSIQSTLKPIVPNVGTHNLSIGLRHTLFSYPSPPTHPSSMYDSLLPLSQSVGPVSQNESPPDGPEQVRSASLQHLCPPLSTRLALSAISMPYVS